jgi:glutaryl-CoA dehydrogenase
MTEPTHGSDASSLQARAREDSRHYVLDGCKRWITNGSIADLLVVWARDDHGAVGGFILEPPLDGFEATPMDGKAACRTADHAGLRLTGVKVPLDNRLERARSFADTRRVLVRSRQGVAWEALGHAMAAYDAAVAHALGRQQFGRPLAASQLVQARLAAMLVDLTAMALLCWRPARPGAPRDGAMASAVKLHAVAAARRIVLEARDFLGVMAFSWTATWHVTSSTWRRSPPMKAPTASTLSSWAGPSPGCPPAIDERLEPRQADRRRRRCGDAVAGRGGGTAANG